jgi:nucleoid-associated protein EbfC
MNPFKGGFTEILQQASRFKDEIQKIQEDAAKKVAEGSAGGGMVKATVNGKQQVLSVTVDPEVFKSNDVTMLQDLVVAAVNEALKASQEMVSEEMGKLTASLGPLASLFNKG